MPWIRNIQTHLVHQLGFLLWRAEFKEFLYDVVTEDIRHQAVSGREDLLEHQLLLSRRGSLQLLLDEPGAVLVLAELHDVIRQVTQLEIWVAVVPAIKGVQLVFMGSSKGVS